jgi:putative photosynthetic complex assembly protein
MQHVSVDGFSDHRIPKAVLCGAAVLLSVAFAGVAAVRLGALPAVESAPSQTVESALLRFEDRPDGGIAVRDAESGRAVAILAPGTNGFVRGVLRGLARERRQHEIGDGPAFRLARLADGRLSLEDVATGRRIDLEAFGPTNAIAFARFLKPEEDINR